MKYKDINIYGDEAVKYDLLVNKYSLFKRYYDVFVYSAIVGFLRKEYKAEKQESSEKFITIKQQIFINNNESEEIFNAIVINHLNERESDNYLKQIIDEDYSTDDKSLKFEIVKNYSLIGLNYLFDKIIGDETDKNMIFCNFVDFFKDFSKIEKHEDRVLESLDEYF